MPDGIKRKLLDITLLKKYKFQFKHNTEDRLKLVVKQFRWFKFTILFSILFFIKVCSLLQFNLVLLGLFATSLIILI